VCCRLRATEGNAVVAGEVVRRATSPASIIIDTSSLAQPRLHLYHEISQEEHTTFVSLIDVVLDYDGLLPRLGFLAADIQLQAAFLP
jgi:hypothetical protein